MQTEKSSRKAKEEEVTNIRTGLSVKALKQAFINNLFYLQGRFPVVATRNIMSKNRAGRHYFVQTIRYY